MNSNKFKGKLVYFTKIEFYLINSWISNGPNIDGYEAALERLKIQFRPCKSLLLGQTFFTSKNFCGRTVYLNKEQVQYLNEIFKSVKLENLNEIYWSDFQRLIGKLKSDNVL